MPNKHRANIIRFAWGRSRLPPAGHFREKFRLSLMRSRTTYLPVAHVCFFQLDLPPYETDELMMQKLLAVSLFGIGGEFLMA